MKFAVGGIEVGVVIILVAPEAIPVAQQRLGGPEGERLLGLGWLQYRLERLHRGFDRVAELMNIGPVVFFFVGFFSHLAP